jgi:hypothetical protein
VCSSGTCQRAACPTGYNVNPDLGEFEEAEILKTFGDVPEDFRSVS